MAGEGNEDLGLDTTALHLMQQTYATLLSVANKVETFADTKHSGLTGRQFMAILAVLHLSPADTTVTKIAHKLGTSKQNTQRMLASLQRKGYVDIAPGVTDRRVVNVTVTAAGGELMGENSMRGARLLADLFRDFTTDEIAALWRLLRKLHVFDGVQYNGFEDDISGTFSALFPDAARASTPESIATENTR